MPQALRHIGLEYEEVDSKLTEGREPFDDDETMKKTCEETLNRSRKKREEQEVREAKKTLYEPKQFN